jgi:hypothetical protein
MSWISALAGLLLVSPSLKAEGATAAAPAASALSWLGYGEFSYQRPADDPAGARADLDRFVLGASYRFDERTRLVSEVEIEHAVSSAGDPGEVAIEQAYIEYQLGDALRARLGLFLVPVGWLNEHHEPARHFGVFRNAVETAIIPTTWREGGLGVEGETAAGLHWDAGLTTGFDLSRWADAGDQAYSAPLAAIHQELAEARAARGAAYVALRYAPLASLTLGASAYGGNIGQGQAGLADPRLVLGELHARWRLGRLAVNALHAEGRISGTAAVNAALSASAAPVPAAFRGSYVEVAALLPGAARCPVSAFLRHEWLDTGARYELPAGLPVPAAQPRQRLLTGGLQCALAPGVVLKADYTDVAGGSAGDRLALGFGYEF